jgi:hypothetical protein
MPEREHPLRGAEIEHRGETAPCLLAGDDRGIAGDAKVHVSIDQRRNQDQPARIDGARAGRSRLRLRCDRFAGDAERPWPRGRVRELAAGDPEHPRSLDHISNGGGDWQVYALCMPDEADELILRMQHLEAQARAQQDARTKQAGVAGLRTAAQRLADESRQDLAGAEAALKAAEEKQERARNGGLSPLEAADLLVQGKAEADEAKVRAVKARARLDFALNRMDEAERREWEALRAEARAETHAQLADDPLFKKP